VTRPSTNARLQEALTRLLAGQAPPGREQLNVTNLCREAGVGRDSYYRSPAAFKATFQTAQAQQAERRAERDTSPRTTAHTHPDHASRVAQLRDTIRVLEETVKVYANQIQALSLANEQLHAETRRYVTNSTVPNSRCIPWTIVAAGHTTNSRSCPAEVRADRQRRVPRVHCVIAQCHPVVRLPSISAWIWARSTCATRPVILVEDTAEDASSPYGCLIGTTTPGAWSGGR
jgi:hypothetical protein